MAFWRWVWLMITCVVALAAIFGQTGWRRKTIFSGGTGSVGMIDVAEMLK
jgi:hypothetical protein